MQNATKISVATWKLHLFSHWNHGSMLRSVLPGFPSGRGPSLFLLATSIHSPEFSCLVSNLHLRCWSCICNQRAFNYRAWSRWIHSYVKISAWLNVNCVWMLILICTNILTCACFLSLFCAFAFVIFCLCLSIFRRRYNTILFLSNSFSYISLSTCIYLPSYLYCGCDLPKFYFTDLVLTFWYNIFNVNPKNIVSPISNASFEDNTKSEQRQIWYRMYNLTNVKNTHGGVLLLAKLQASAL